MFDLNKATRNFLLKNSLTIRNGFINEGLIVYDLGCKFKDFEQLERIYFQALKRNIGNRVINLAINFKSYNLT
jgi:hypothetical protein